jgi:riboflavin synthase
MFSGIIEAVGTLSDITPRGSDAHVRIAVGAMDLSDVKIGDSISVSGVCLTATAVTSAAFEADVSAETLARTTFGRRKIGDRVNLEKALVVNERLGGHLVSGHIDDVARLAARTVDGRSVKLTFGVAHGLARYIAVKGSIGVDGVSLTVNEVDGDRFGVNIVPHTLEATTLGSLNVGDAVNLEVDLIARYLERLLTGDIADSITPDALARYGFRRDR